MNVYLTHGNSHDKYLIEFNDKLIHSCSQCLTYLSKDTAIKLYTEAATETPCIYGTVLHINHPRIHAERNLQ